MSPHWVKTVSAGGWHTVTVAMDGTLWSWGDNESGQIGDDTMTTYNQWGQLENDNTRTFPVRIGTASNWSSVSAGQHHTVAIRTDGTLWSWGNNEQGQLGDGTTTRRTSPIRIGTDSNWAFAAAGGYHTVAVKTDGTLWAWGNNEHGRLGDGTATRRTSPTRIGIETNWATVSAGWQHTVAVKRDGTLWAWGNNEDGRLGSVWAECCCDMSHSTVPVQIGTETNWAFVSAGWRHTTALRTDGSLWAWGFNNTGQIGDGTTVGRFAPVRVGTNNDWIAVSAGNNHTLAVRIDGSLWAWGYNADGRLGDGSTNNRSNPLRINMPPGWNAALVSAGGSHTMVIGADNMLMGWGGGWNGRQLGGNSSDGSGRSIPVRTLR
jgi:alpha-tubulin suppressor-like RCC1 family protein